MYYGGGLLVVEEAQDGERGVTPKGVMQQG